jgi:transcription elongation GreA/GreB family factor
MKAEILAALIQQVATEIQALDISAKSAYAAATHEESRAEDQHDTRSTEASYLAAGTAKRLAELKRTAEILKNFPVRKFSEDAAITLGALVELSLGKSHIWYFILPVCGGYKAVIADTTVNVITPQSVLGEAVLEKHAGDEIETRVGKDTRAYQVISIS